MRVLSLILALSIAVPALPIPITKDRLLDNLPDTILGSVSDLLGYPKNPNGPGDAADPLLCGYGPVFCLPECATQCAGGSEACATCFTNCARTRGCDYNGVDNGNGKTGDGDKVNIDNDGA
ncbi:hypothetical protein F4779DRAFT_139904 [Xylariaceae sp. FL0662B]|nr:hypothetical protein F4779DRAFT_139904 [Xylariaceae sp. FL0662B]